MTEEKTQETEWKGKFLSRGDVMEEVLIKLEKVHVLLEHLDKQYGWSGNQDLCAAIALKLRFPEESLAKEEDLLRNRCCDWTLNHGNIMTFLDIVDDYVYGSARRIREEMATVK